MPGYDEQSAAVYDEIQRERLAEADTAVDLLAGLAGAGPVLELGIGTGRLALPLARRGFVVHGIDASQPMVDRLRAKPGGDRIGVVMGDFADIGFLVTGPYALVFVAFNTLFELATQDDQARCFAGAAAVLSGGGLFVVEALVPEVTVEQAVSVGNVDGDGVVLDAAVRDVNQQVVFASITVTERSVGVHTNSIRFATLSELDLMARLAGLHLRDRWAGWKGEAFTTSSTRHVSVFEKRR